VLPVTEVASVTTRSTAKFLAVALVGLSAVLAAGAIGLRMAVTSHDVHAAVIEALGKDGGRAFTMGGLKMAAWPQPVAVLEDVAFGDGKPATLTAPIVTASLRLLPLLVGRVEIGELVLEHPQIVWNINRGPLAPASLDRPPDLRIVDGRIDIVGASGLIERLDAVTGEVEQGSSTLTLSGAFRLREEPVEAMLAIDDTAALARGARTPLRLQLAAPAATVSFDGYALAGRTLKLDGALATDGASLRAALGWFDIEPPLRGGLGRFALAGKIAVSGGQFALSQASLELDGNRAEGGLTVRVENGRPTLQGTLAAKALTLDPYLNALPIQRAGAWTSEPFDLSPLAALDADIRLSAGSIAVGQAEIGRAAGAVVIRGGRLSLTMGEAETFAGLLRGTLALALLPGGAELRLDAVARDVDLDRLGQDVFGARRFEGRGLVALALEGHGASAAALARSLTGEVRISAENGALAGVNVEQILRRIEKRPLAGTGDLRGGHTAFDRLALLFKVESGMATCDDVVMEGPQVRIQLKGGASIAQRDVDLKGIAALVRPDGPAFELPFVIRGPWSSPSVVPDAESLIRRSGAAAPLLERAVRRAAPTASTTAGVVEPTSDTSAAAATP
jgi:AsmA protein